MRRHIIAILALGLLTISMTGCQKSTPKPGSISGYDEGEQYLSIWVHSIEDTDEGRCYREAVDTFNDVYNGQYFADIEFIPRNDNGGGYTDKINASVMSGDLPDVLTVDGPNIVAYAENGIIQPLAELSKEEKEAYLESIIDQGTYNDKLYALGAAETIVALYFNKDILAEAGIEVPDADNPWTQTELLEVLEKIKPIMDEKNGYALDMAFPIGEATIYYYAPFFWANGGDFVDEAGLSVDGIFNSEQNVKTVSYFSSLLEKGYMSKAPIENLFEAGRAAFKVDGPWEVNTLYTSYPDISFGIAPYVVGEQWSGEPYISTGSWAFAASTKTSNIEGATELVKWMSGVDSGKRLWEQTKAFPSTHEAFDSITAFQTDENYSALYYQLSTYGRPRPKTPIYPQLSTSFQQVLENSVLSGYDPKEQLDKSVERINAKLKRYILE